MSEDIHATLEAVKRLRAEARIDPVRADDRVRLRSWQASRLAATYPDLLASDRYRPAAQFFLSDLYGPKDFSQRDEEVARILPTIGRLLPETALTAFGAAIELDRLSEELDAAMMHELRRLQPSGPLEIAPERYADAYRACGRRDSRQRQIGLADAIGASLDRLTHKPLLGLALAMMHGPARMAGLLELQEFFLRGFEAFRHMHGAAEFLAIIRTRETRLMERLFAEVAMPFEEPA